MFCPFCGIKNNPEQQSCFICQKKLPSLDAELPAPRPRVIRSLARPAETAGFGERLLAAILDLLLIAAVLIVAWAALWSRVVIVRSVSLAIVIACAVSAAALVVFGYTWLLSDATFGKALAGVRVVRREQPLSVWRRTGVIALWLIVVAAALWGAFTMCPQCFGR
jgi:uncharacterized RDD family membrane protein YckC